MVNNTWRKLKGFWSDLYNQVEKNGWEDAGHWMTKNLQLLAYSRMDFIVCVRSLLEPPSFFAPRSNVILRPATYIDLPLFEHLVPPSTLQYFDYRLANGRYCLLALDGERLAGYNWTTVRVEFEVDNLKMSLHQGDVYGDHSFTFPEYRRRGIQSALHLYRLSYMKEQGYKRIVVLVDKKNTAGLYMIKKFGYEEADLLSFRRVFLKRIYHYHKNNF